MVALGFRLRSSRPRSLFQLIEFAMQVSINGTLVPKEQAVVSVFDHGLLYGDGVFEGIRVYGGKVFLHDEHLTRLYESATAIRLEIPLPLPSLKRAVEETVAANKIQDGYIRLVITRGAGGLGLDIQDEPSSDHHH